RGMVYFRLPIANCRFENAFWLTSQSAIGNQKSAILFHSPISHDHFLRALVVARLVAARRLSPGRHRITAAGSLAFATAMRMVHRVHRHAAHVRTNSAPTIAARLAQRN